MNNSEIPLKNLGSNHQIQRIIRFMHYTSELAIPHPVFLFATVE